MNVSRMLAETGLLTFFKALFRVWLIRKSLFLLGVKYEATDSNPAVPTIFSFNFNVIRISAKYVSTLLADVAMLAVPALRILKTHSARIAAVLGLFLLVSCSSECKKITHAPSPSNVNPVTIECQSEGNNK